VVVIYDLVIPPVVGVIVEKYPLGQDVLPERMGRLTNLIVTPSRRLNIKLGKV